MTVRENSSPNRTLSLPLPLPLKPSCPSLNRLYTCAFTIPHLPTDCFDCCSLVHPFLPYADNHNTLLPIDHVARLCSESSTGLHQCDLGANVCTTSTLSLLQNYTPLSVPFDLLGADASVQGMLCPGYGYYPLQFSDGSTTPVIMYYCPQLSETLLSPQHICTQTSNNYSGFDICCQDLDQAYIRF